VPLLNHAVARDRNRVQPPSRRGASGATCWRAGIEASSVIAAARATRRGRTREAGRGVGRALGCGTRGRAQSSEPGRGEVGAGRTHGPADACCGAKYSRLALRLLAREDRDPVETLVPDAADPALRVRLRPRRRERADLSERRRDHRARSDGFPGSERTQGGEEPWRELVRSLAGAVTSAPSARLLRS
jgi:hypothetical protein